MPHPTPKLTWCKARLGTDMNWWVHEISDPVHWDVDMLGIIDPRQFQHLLDLMEPLSDYGLQTGIIEEAFYAFTIDEVLKDKSVVLKRSDEHLRESEEQRFALPDVLDEEKGPYADLLDHITRLRIKMLNDVIDFAQQLTIEELEEEIREGQGADFMEGRATHFFKELTAILEFVPEGFELEEDESGGPKSDDEDLQNDLADVDAGEETESNIETDDTMRWDEEEDEEENGDKAAGPNNGESGDKDGKQ